MQQLEKKCPYCAKLVETEANFCRFCGSGLNIIGVVNNSVVSPKVVACPYCNVQLTTKQVYKTVTFLGLLGAGLFLIGLLVACTVNSVIGIVIILVSLLASVGNRKKTVLVCPNCGKEGRTL